MIYALTAFSLACLAGAVWFWRERHRLTEQRDFWKSAAIAMERRFHELRDDTPARGSDGKFTRRNRNG